MEVKAHHLSHDACREGHATEYARRGHRLAVLRRRDRSFLHDDDRDGHWGLRYGREGDGRARLDDGDGVDGRRRLCKAYRVSEAES